MLIIRFQEVYKTLVLSVQMKFICDQNLNVKTFDINYRQKSIYSFVFMPQITQNLFLIVIQMYFNLKYDKTIKVCRN